MGYSSSGCALCYLSGNGCGYENYRDYNVCFICLESAASENPDGCHYKVRFAEFAGEFGVKCDCCSVQRCLLYKLCVCDFHINK